MTFKRFLRYAALALLALLSIAVAVSGYFLARRQIAVYVLAKNAAALKADYAPLRVLILSRSDEAVSARCFLYDADGREIASFERSWSGWALDVESISVPVSGRVFAFPSRISAGRASPRGGTDLFPYYDKGGFPAIFDSSALSPALRSAFSGLFAFVKAFGGTKSIPVRLRDAEVGAVYLLTAYRDGRTSFSRE